MDKMKFGPVPSNLHVGDTIVWVNKDIFRHTATAANGSFNVILDPNKTATTTLRKAGTIPFTCIYHPGMRGVLHVGK
jgi:plastocyanin